VQGVAHLVDCVRHNTAPVNSATHARHVLDIMLTARVLPGGTGAGAADDLFAAMDAMKRRTYGSET